MTSMFRGNSTLAAWSCQRSELTHQNHFGVAPTADLSALVRNAISIEYYGRQKSETTVSFDSGVHKKWTLKAIFLCATKKILN